MDHNQEPTAADIATEVADIVMPELKKYMDNKFATFEERMDNKFATFEERILKEVRQTVTEVMTNHFTHSAA